MQMIATGWARLPRLVVGAALMLFAERHIGETALGYCVSIAGMAVFFTGWVGLCPACYLGRCQLAPTADDAEPPARPS